MGYSLSLVDHPRCQVVEVFNADAAADEQLAGRELRGATPMEKNSVTDIGHSYRGIFNNMLVVSKDKPHGARRTTGRSRESGSVQHLL